MEREYRSCLGRDGGSSSYTLEAIANTCIDPSVRMASSRPSDSISDPRSAKGYANTVPFVNSSFHAKGKAGKVPPYRVNSQTHNFVTSAFDHRSIGKSPATSIRISRFCLASISQSFLQASIRMRHCKQGCYRRQPTLYYERTVEIGTRYIYQGPRHDGHRACQRHCDDVNVHIRS